jgi:nitrous oxidase accessory protein NosD
LKLPLQIREYVPAGGECVMIWDAGKNRIAECVLRENAQAIVAAVNASMKHRDSTNTSQVLAEK